MLRAQAGAMPSGVIKRCRLSWLTNSAFVYEPKCGGGGGVAGSQPMSTAVHMGPKKLRRSNAIFNLWMSLRDGAAALALASVAACGPTSGPAVSDGRRHGHFPEMWHIYKLDFRVKLVAVKVAVKVAVSPSL
jgi:hypothetical protein